MELLDTPETKPATEIIFGRLEQKMSPRLRHGKAQVRLGAMLETASRGNGQVATEWDCYLELPDGDRGKIVPDVSYYSFERNPHGAEHEQAPWIAPDIAIEIISPSERPARIAYKLELYRANGAAEVVFVDPQARTIAVFHQRGSIEFVDGENAYLNTLPKFVIDVSKFFDELDD